MEDFIRVDDWIPEEEDIKITYDGKVMIIPFDEIFGRPGIDALNAFIIKKESYVKQFDMLTKYINYFIKYYDDDNELILQYLKLKYIIDDKENHISLSEFIRTLYIILFTDSMQKKIIQMVEDNYYIDLSSKSNIKYNESLEFTQEHAKVLMQISVSIKIMVPIVFHYLNTYGLIKHRELIYRFYDPLFTIYGKEIDIYNKLWIIVNSKVHVNYIRNKTIWLQREIFGTIQYTHMDELLKDKIISETLFKFEFSRNIINFTYVNLEKQLNYFLMEPYQENRIEVSDQKDKLTGLSSLDKLEINSAKIDESVVILSKLNIKKTIKRLMKATNIKISREELEYYRKHLNITEFQSQIVFYYYAKYFNGYRDLNMINRTQYLKLLLILKKRLQYQQYVYLPEILTSNIDGKLNSRTIRNEKFLTKIQTSSIYQSIIENKYSVLKDIDKEPLILKMLSRLLNTKFTLVSYDHQDKLNEHIEVNPDDICDEFLNFLNQL